MANTGNTQQQINYGAAANDGNGDPLRTAFIKTDDNFDNVWLAGPVGSNITIANNTIQVNNTNGNLILQPNGVGAIQTNSKLLPRLNNTYDLGSTTLKYRAGYFGQGGLTVDGNVTVTGNLTAGNISYTGNVFVGDLQGSVFADDSTIMVDAIDNTMFASAATFGGISSGNILPLANVTYNLGSSARQWNDLWLSNATIYMNSVPLSLTAGNVLTVNGNAVLTNNSNTTISTTGNISGNYFIGNGSLLTGIVSSYGNANVVANLAALGSNPVSTTGNISGNYFIGNGSQLTGMAATGNLDIVGTTISIANGAPEAYINLSADLQGWAYVQVPTDATANVTNTRIHNDAGNIEFGTGDFSTGSTNYTWTLDNTGNLNLPADGDLNFSGGSIAQTLNEDIYIRASDDENDGWSVYNVVDDGAGNILSQTRLEFDQYTIRTDAQGASYTWAFRDSGVLELPGDIYGNVGGNLTIKIGDQAGSDTFIDLQTRSYVGDALISNIHIGNPNVTVSTASAAYNWTFDGTGNLTVPGNSIVSTATATGGAGGNSITIQAGAADQSNFFNTPGGNVNINGGLGAFNDGGGGGPGGDININSGLSSDPAGHAGNVNIGAGISGWTFDYTGNITLPQGGVVYETGIPSGGLSGNTIALKPSGGTNADQQLLVYPTAGADFNHLHLTSGNLYNTELFLGSDDLYVKLANTGNVVINSNDGNSNTAQWTFGTQGTILNSGNLTLQTPNGVPGAVTAVTGSSGFWESNPRSNLATTGGNGGGLTVNVTETGGYASAIAIATAGTGYSNGDAITVTSGSSSATFTISVLANDWTIDTAGNLTVAGSIIMPPGASLIGTGASPAPTISGFGTISSANVITGDISLTNGRINGGEATVVTDGINSIALAPGAQMDLFGFPFSAGTSRGQLTISGITSTTQANGTWYYQSVNTYTYQLYTDSTYSTLVDASGWTAYTGGGSVAITLQDPLANVVINSNGYFSTFGNDGSLSLPGDLTVVGDISGNTAGYAIGYRDIPQVSFTGNATIATTDAGKHYYSTQSSNYILTIANNASQGFQVGSAITVVNQGTGTITVAQGSGVTLYLAGNATAGNRSVSTFGMATIMKVATDTWFINGTGVS